MNALLTFPGIQLYNVRRREVVCHCEAHSGDTVTQIDARLPDGRPVAIMHDWQGYHLAIGSRNTVGKFPYNEPMTPEQIQKALQEAMK